jgi:hypothetical protein
MGFWPRVCGGRPAHASRWVASPRPRAARPRSCVGCGREVPLGQGRVGESCSANGLRVLRQRGRGCQRAARGVLGGGLVRPSCYWRYEPAAQDRSRRDTKPASRCLSGHESRRRSRPWRGRGCSPDQSCGLNRQPRRATQLLTTGDWVRSARPPCTDVTTDVGSSPSRSPHSGSCSGSGSRSSNGRDPVPASSVTVSRRGARSSRGSGARASRLPGSGTELASPRKSAPASIDDLTYVRTADVDRSAWADARSSNRAPGCLWDWPSIGTDPALGPTRPPRMPQWKRGVWGLP